MTRNASEQEPVTGGISADGRSEFVTRVMRDEFFGGPDLETASPYDATDPPKRIDPG
jgi:hypothetical protein